LDIFLLVVDALVEVLVATSWEVVPVTGMVEEAVV
jgi:hypothetical protein